MLSHLWRIPWIVIYSPVRMQVEQFVYGRQALSSEHSHYILSLAYSNDGNTLACGYGVNTDFDEESNHIVQL